VLDHNLRRSFWSLPGMLTLCIQELSINQCAVPQGLKVVFRASIGDVMLGNLELPQDGTGIGCLPTWNVQLPGLVTPLALSIQCVSPINGDLQQLGSIEVPLLGLDGTTGESIVSEHQIETVQQSVHPISGSTPGGGEASTPGGGDDLGDWVDMTKTSFAKVTLAASYLNNLLPS
jgi:hypothetical protein